MEGCTFIDSDSTKSFNEVWYLAGYPPTPSAVERARSAGPSPVRPAGLKETACRHEGCSLVASGLKVFSYRTQGRSLKATGVPGSPDKSGQVPTSSGLSRVVPTSWAGHPQRAPGPPRHARSVLGPSGSNIRPP